MLENWVLSFCHSPCSSPQSDLLSSSGLSSRRARTDSPSSSRTSSAPSLCRLPPKALRNRLCPSLRLALSVASASQSDLSRLPIRASPADTRSSTTSLRLSRCSIAFAKGTSFGSGSRSSAWTENVSPCLVAALILVLSVLEASSTRGPWLQSLRAPAPRSAGFPPVVNAFPIARSAVRSVNLAGCAKLYSKYSFLSKDAVPRLSVLRDLMWGHGSGVWLGSPRM